jgi:membrane-bound serine protease (ClpP class)
MHRLLRLLCLPCLGALLGLVAGLGVTTPAQAASAAPANGSARGAAAASAPSGVAQGAGGVAQGAAGLAQGAGGVAQGAAGLAQGAGGPTVEVFTLSGVLDQSLLGDLRGAIAGAERRGARAFLIQLDSFGGLGADPAEVQRVVADATVPVAVWVGPRAAQAGGASVFLLAKADVVSSSRQARIGPALPAELGRGRDNGAEASLFAASGLPAEVQRGTIDGARAESLHLTAYQAESLPDAVRQLDGRQADGRAIEVTGFQVRFLSSSLFDRVRHGLANPTLAYLLLLAAAACLSFEWFQPGFGVAGIAGVLIGLLAVYSLVVLPTNWLALAVLVAGTIAFTADTARGGLGALTGLAAILTAAGSWWLFSSPSALLRVDGRLAVLGTLWSVSWFVVIMTMLLRSQRQAPTGTEALVGARGVVRSILNPGGIVVIEGAMWRADLVGGGLLPTGQRVQVDAVEKGILQVTAEDPAAVRPARKRLRPARPARERG